MRKMDRDKHPKQSPPPAGVAVTVKPGALSRDVLYLPRGLAPPLSSSECHAAPSGFRTPLQECKDNQG